jgi:CRISPR-associated protein Csx14
MIKIPVQLKNPGEYFACLGLWELAERLNIGKAPTKGRFEFNPQKSIFKADFCIETNLTESDLLKGLYSCTARVEDPASPTSLVHFDPINLTLDWWLTKNDRSPLKTWAGRVNGPQIIVDMLEMAKASKIQNVDKIFKERSFRNRKGTQHLLYMDTTSAGGSYRGYSTDMAGVKVAEPYFVELLASVGLQRFRPFYNEEKKEFYYVTWTTPLTCNQAFVAIRYGVPLLDVRRFVFHSKLKGTQGYYQFCSAEEQKRRAIMSSYN